MKKKTIQNHNTGNKIEMEDAITINTGFSLGIDSDILNPSGKEYFSGESIDEHRIIEQANEYIAEEEIKQEYNNL